MYYVVYGFLYLFSLLPLAVLYLFSDLAFLILYYFVRYRKDVVTANLLQAFPEKTKKERKQIARKFYRNFADTFIETIKLISCNEAFVNKRFKADFSIFEYLYARGRKCQLHAGHNFNWELANIAIAMNVPHKLLGVYQPIKNKIFDRLFGKLRAKSGTTMLPATDMRNAMLPYRDTLYALGLVADQNPPDMKRACWIQFLGKPTPFIVGPENAARKENIPVIFCYGWKLKRGVYQCSFELAEENPATTIPGELTLKYAHFMEHIIRLHPDVWLWSHRRWRHEWKPEYGEIIG